MVKAIQVYDMITITNVITSVTAAEMNPIISTNLVSEQEICRRGVVSQKKRSTKLGAQKSRFRPYRSGGKMTKNPANQQLRTSCLQILPFMMVV